MRKCAEAQPRYGELWIQISKDIENWRMKCEDILLSASELLSF